MKTACLITVILATLVACPVAAEKNYDISEVRVIETSSGFMYAYEDEDGQLVVRDVPPPGYLEALTAAQAKQEEEPEPEAEPPVVIVVPEKEPAAWRALLLPLLPVVLILAAAYVFYVPFVRRWLGESKLERVLRHAGWPVFKNIELSTDAHPATRVDCLARAPAGVLVFTNAHLAGRISGGPDHDVWIQTTRSDRIPIDNPLRKNTRDARVVKALVGDVPVHGRVVYTGQAEFPEEAPARLQKLSDFVENLDQFRNEAPNQRRLDGSWRTLMRYPHANKVAVRALGAGWKRWLYDRWRPITSGSLLTSAVLIMMAMIVMRWINSG